MLDPKTMKYTFVDTCFTTHHLKFANDANDTLWASSGGGSGAVGWLNTKMFDETGDAQKAQGWTAARCSTPTATASATKVTSSPTSRSIRPRTSGSPRCSTR